MSRLLICDPICAQGFGHNLSALHYFSKFLSKKFGVSNVEALVSKYLPEDLSDAKSLKLDRIYHHYYQSSMPFRNYDDKQESRSFKTLVSSYNYMENLAYEDCLTILDKYKLTEKDVLFFPSVDFYSAQAILRYYETKEIHQVPKLYLRFIGVMENNTKYYSEPRNELFSLIRSLGGKGYPLYLSAETPKYADFISERVEENVSCLTYPVMGDMLPIKQRTSSFNILCPGAQREDKGFSRLFDIIKEFTMANPDVEANFYIQTVPGDRYSSYQSQLYALPGVKLLPSSITMEQMVSLYKDAHAVLLPYDADVYYLRGSAVLMEAISYGRLVLTSTFTAFSEQVRYYNCGKICESDEDFAYSLREFYDMNLSKMQRQAKQSRFRYEKDCDFSYRSWFQC